MFSSLDANGFLFGDVFNNHALWGTNESIPKVSKKRQRNSKSGFQENKTGESSDNKLKKIIHRDVERQRRQDMAKLYASLRSHLPLHCTKAKCSISDTMHEAVNYIKHMQKKLKEMEMQKKSLMKTHYSPGDNSCSENGSSKIMDDFPNCITVSSIPDGVEILINTVINEEGFSLSRVIQKLLETGLIVVNCVSTKANERFLYKIQSEAHDRTSINVSVLYKRLCNVISL